MRTWILAAVQAGQRIPEVESNSYESLYERHGAALPPDSSIGNGDFDLIGAIELNLLQQEGLRPTNTVLDFGCGTGRLAVHLVPALSGGRYVGIDIARSMLDRAEHRVKTLVPKTTCQVSWIKQTTPSFLLQDESADFICAFSVFTHMEHEDSFRYLKSALQVVRPGGKFLLSCLPMNLEAAREIFLASAQDDRDVRWRTVRNVTTSTEMMESVALLAGWEITRWYPGDAPNVTVPGRGNFGLGQSTLVLRRGT